MEAIALPRETLPRAKRRIRFGLRRTRSIRLNLVPCLAMILLLTAGCLVYVRARATVLHERYLLEEAQREQVRLQMENRTLRLAWATYTSPKQLEDVARKRFKLHYPRVHEVVRLP